eukprot:4364495-Amphidinium_carterae.1
MSSFVTLECGRHFHFDPGLVLGTDGAVEIPFTRWEVNDYYDTNPDAIGKMYVRHGAFVEGAC